MSTTAPHTERITTAVLLALWQQPETTLQNLLRHTLAPLPDVHQSLQLLRQRKCQIEQTPTAIRLVSTGLPCWRDVLEHIAKSENLRVGQQVMVFHRTASTNDIAWQAAANPANDGLLVLADEQSAGRGRMGHAWSAKPEQSVLLSLLLRNTVAQSLDQFTLLAGLAAARAIEDAAQVQARHPLRVQIKWPNDLLIDGRKLAGILVEKKGDHVVIGIGVNVAQAAADFPAEFAPRAASLYQATGAMLDRLRIVAALARRLDKLPAQADSPETSWIAEWKSRCSILGSHITARSEGMRIAGQVIDIDPLHGLVIRDGAGVMRFLSAPVTTLAL